MKDYSNYHGYDPLERRLRNGKKIFEVSKRGINSYKAIVDGLIETDIIIERSYNPYSEKKEERIFKCDLETDIALGSTIYIEEENQTFISVTPINKNRMYKFFKGIEMNYYINWVDDNGDLRKSHCCMYDKDVYSVGIKEIIFIPTLHEQVFITLQQNENTDTINRGTRFIIDGNAWQVTNINRALGKLMKLSVKEVTKDKDDNIVDEIPNVDAIKQYSISILDGSSISVTKGKTFKLTTEVRKGDEILLDSIVVYSSQDPTIASVDGNGLITGVSDGITIIEARYNDITTSVEVSIESVDLITYKAIIEGSTSIRNGRNSTYTNKPTANGEIVELLSEWYITDDNDEATDLATFVASGNSCEVMATKQSKVGFIKLHVKCGTEVIDEINGTTFNEVVRDYKRIEIKSIFAP